MPFLATMPITMIRPMNEERLNVVPVTSSARKTPQVESSAEDSTARGAAKSPNSNSSTMNTSTIASTSTNTRSWNDFCCSSILAAVLHADAGRQVQVGDGLLHLGHAVAQVHAFEARGHLHVALQVLAADFGLAGDLASWWPASRWWRSCRCR